MDVMHIIRGSCRIDKTSTWRYRSLPSSPRRISVPKMFSLGNKKTDGGKTACRRMHNTRTHAGNASLRREFRSPLAAPLSNNRCGGPVYGRRLVQPLSYLFARVLKCKFFLFHVFFFSCIEHETWRLPACWPACLPATALLRSAFCRRAARRPRAERGLVHAGRTRVVFWLHVWS